MGGCRRSMLASPGRHPICGGFSKGWFPKGWFWRMFPGPPKPERVPKTERRYQKTERRYKKRSEGTKNWNEGIFAKTTLLQNSPFVCSGIWSIAAVLLQIAVELVVEDVGGVLIHT